MQTIFLIELFVFALLMPAVPPAKTNDIHRRDLALATQPRSPQTSDPANIHAYRKMLDRYFKGHPELTRFYVDAMPDGKTGSSPKAWYEVKNENELLDAEREYANRSAIVSMKDGKIVSVEIGEPEEHSGHQNRYYFRSDGTVGLIFSDFSSNTEGVHVRRENLYGADGRPLQSTTQCFNIVHTSKGSHEKRASCRQAAMRRELREYKVPIYKMNSELPGFDILKSR